MAPFLTCLWQAPHTQEKGEAVSQPGVMKPRLSPAESVGTGIWDMPRHLGLSGFAAGSDSPM